MKRLRQLLALPATSRNLLLKSAFLLLIARLALACFPFEALRKRALRFFPPPNANAPDWLRVETVAWAVDRAALAVGGACLPQALVGEWLLRRSGQAVELRVGVAKDSEGKLDAHAWLEVDGRTIIGALDEMSRYATFPSLDIPPTGS